MFDLNNLQKVLVGCSVKIVAPEEKKKDRKAQTGRASRPPPRAKSDTSRWQHHRQPDSSPRLAQCTSADLGYWPLGQLQSMLSEIHRHFSWPQLLSMVDCIRERLKMRRANRFSLRVLTNSAYIQTGASLLENLSSSLSTCPSDYYVVVYQPGVHSSDFSTRKSAPRLGAKMLGKDRSIRSKMSVNEVAGLLEPKQIKSLLEEKCNVQTTAVDASCELP